jgi:endogenous inhibitor of DNA gyrase (YacG/DUF329 family)
MHVGAPIWTLKALCPICGQGSCLALVSCPECGRLAVVCDEEGSFFPEPRDLSKIAAASSACPTCARVSASSFIPASDVTIRAFGFSEIEYE